MRRLLWFPLLLALVLPAQGANPVIRLSGAPPFYRIEGSGLQQVAAFDLTLHYNPVLLTVDGVETGPLLQGAMSASNLNRPGIARLAAVSATPVSGAGLIASFRVRTSGLVAADPTLTVALRDSAGKALAVTIENNLLVPIPAPVVADETGPTTPPPVASATETATATPVATTPPSVTTSAGHRGGGVFAGGVSGSIVPEPAAITPVPSEPSSLPPLPPPSGNETAASVFPGPPLPERPTLITESPYQAFCTGIPAIKTLDELSRLLAHPAGVSQTPAYLLSDGKTKVTLKIDGIERLPSLAIQGGRLLDSWLGNDRVLHLELLPDAGAKRLSIVMVEEVLRTVELIIAPPLKLRSKRVGDKDLRQLQADGGKAGASCEERWTLAVNLLAQWAKDREAPGGSGKGR